MADITKCVNETCPLKEKCYRYTALSDEYQSVAKFEYQEFQGKVMCDWFWDNKGYKLRENGD